MCRFAERAQSLREEREENSRNTAYAVGYHHSEVVMGISERTANSGPTSERFTTAVTASSVRLQNSISRSRIHTRRNPAHTPPASDRYQAEMEKNATTPILPPEYRNVSIRILLTPSGCASKFISLNITQWLATIISMDNMRSSSTLEFRDPERPAIFNPPNTQSININESGCQISR